MRLRPRGVRKGRGARGELWCRTGTTAKDEDRSTGWWPQHKVMAAAQGGGGSTG